MGMAPRITISNPGVSHESSRAAAGLDCVLRINALPHYPTVKFISRVIESGSGPEVGLTWIAWPHNLLGYQNQILGLFYLMLSW